MQYADATIKEVLRLAVIINTVPKRALTTFELCGYTIPEVRGPDFCKIFNFFRCKSSEKRSFPTLHSVPGQTTMAVAVASFACSWPEKS